MILYELVRYYDRKSQDPDPSQRLPSLGLEDKEIAFVIELHGDGRVNQLLDTRSLDGKRLRAQTFLVSQGEKKTSGVKANLLWDSAAYVIGLDRERKGKAEITPAAAFRARIETLPEQTKADAGIHAVLAALDRGDWSVLHAHPAWPEIEASNPVMTFRLVGDRELVCQRPAVVHAASPVAAEDAAPNRVCLIDGVPRPVQRLHSSIKGVWGAQSSGANIVSFNARAFESYGKTDRQGENAPIGQRAAFAYTTALNHLLGKDSRNRVQVGDASTVFWADRASAFDTLLGDLFGEHIDDPDRGVRAVQALFDALKTGQLPVGERDVRFFVLGLAPNAARISVRFWLNAPLAELAPRIAQHFKDTELVRRYDSDPVAPSLFRMLRSLCLREEIKHLPPRLAGEWIRAILEGLPYPPTLLNAAVNRCKAEQASRNSQGTREDNVPYLRAAAIKAWLNRWSRIHQPHEKEFTVALDLHNTDAAYRLGRLFAAYERIQTDAAGRELNRTIRDAYFGSAMSTPASVFPRLMKLSQHHMRDLKRSNAGLHIVRDRLLTEIAGEIDGKSAFPPTMSLPSQGRFALGYYHQRQAFFTRKEATDTTTTIKEE